jgi:RNA 3'-terminal phosphate cyclase (ATP)
MSKMIKLDGSVGEGGGQILRTALSLSMVTQQPFTIENIRAKRPKPGLLRQHLTAVRAAASICNAELDGAELGATRLVFQPRQIRGGEYAFAIGSAGSATLVLQTLLPALMCADRSSHVTIEGGTHNSMAPPFHFIERSFVPLLVRMGAKVNVAIQRYGFYPAGGGRVVANIDPTPPLTPISLADRGALRRGFAESYIAAVPIHVAERELETIGRTMGWASSELMIRGLDKRQGPGNVLLVTLEHENVTEVFAGFGEKGKTAEQVAREAYREARAYLAKPAAVGAMLADQLMIPFSMAGGGYFTTHDVTDHARTNARVIEAFLPIRIEQESHDGGITMLSFQRV